MKTAYVSDAKCPTLSLQSVESEEPLMTASRRYTSDDEISLLTAPTYQESFNRFAAQFAADVFVTPERPIAYIVKQSILKSAPSGKSDYLEHNNFWANLDDKVAFQMCSEGESRCYKKRDDGTRTISQSISFVGDVKVEREGEEVSLSDPKGHTVKLFQMPKEGADSLLQQLDYVPLPRVQQINFLHQFPDDRFFAVTKTSYSWDYSAFLGKPGDMAFQRVLHRMTFRDGGTTDLKTDAGDFHFPSQWPKPGRPACFSFNGSDTVFTLKSFDHNQKLAIAKQLGLINDDSALPVAPDLSHEPNPRLIDLLPNI